MYRIAGSDYKALFKRSFSTGFELSCSTGSVPGKFACYTSGYRGKEFDILHFRGTFKEPVALDDLYDNTHVSLHFQLKGQSDACISGFNAGLPMHQQEFNLLNCVDPKSSFVFPQQQQYEYLCIGISPNLFQSCISSFGTGFDEMLTSSFRKKPFQAYAENRRLTPEIRSQLSRLVHIPVSDDLRQNYIENKIGELLLLALGQREELRTSSYKSDTELFFAIRNFLQVHFLETLSLKQIALQFGINEFKLKRGYKLLFGYTVFGFIHALRMEYAHQLLTSGNYSVDETGTIVGYTSTSAFIRAFNIYYQMSPGQLSKKALGLNS